MTESLLDELYRQLCKLEAEGRNGLWARWLKNAFAPVLMGQFDFVVGNPPWVNWQNLSPEYREATKMLWADYGLFSLRGHAARLGGGKKDLAMLFTYASIDHYLRVGGKLGFLITQTVFKTKGAGDGFRRFRLGEEGDHLRVLHVDDMSRLQPFEGATNRTSVMVCQRGEKTRYPVPYTLWHRGKGSARVPIDKPLSQVMEETVRTRPFAQPVDGKKLTSPWMTATRGALKALQKVIGPAAYRARAGSCTWANGIYWVRILAKRPDGLWVIDNLQHVGRRRVPSEQSPVEPELVFPLLRGREVARWQAQSSVHILVVQDPTTRKGYDEAKMRVEYPHLYGYLKRFEDILRSRSGLRRYFDVGKDAFYSMYNVADYTFAPYKVVWREQASVLTVAVVGSKEGKVVVPDHKLMLVPFQEEQEAHYVCGVLASLVAQAVVKSYVLSTSTSTHVLEHVAVPQFDAANPLHADLADLSMRAHKLVVSGEPEDLEALVEVEDQVDRAAAELWGLTGAELREIRRSLEELA